MASTVKLPVFGPTNKGTVAGVIIAGGVVSGYMIYRNRKKASEAAAASQASAAASYGYAYGYGATGAGQGITYGYGASGGFPPTGYYGYGAVAPPSSGTTPGIPAATNAQWVQAAITQLTQTGYSAQRVAKVLGEYITGAPIAPDDVQIVDAAIGIEGYPPDAGKNDFPPGIHTGGTTGGGHNTEKVTVPHVRGLSAVRAQQLLTEAGLKDHQTPAHVPQGSHGTVSSQSPMAGRKVAPGSTVTVRIKVAK